MQAQAKTTTRSTKKPGMNSMFRQMKIEPNSKLHESPVFPVPLDHHSPPHFSRISPVRKSALEFDVDPLAPSFRVTSPKRNSLNFTLEQLPESFNPPPLSSNTYATDAFDTEMSNLSDLDVSFDKALDNHQYNPRWSGARLSLAASLSSLDTKEKQTSPTCINAVTPFGERNQGPILSPGFDDIMGFEYYFDQGISTPDLPDFEEVCNILPKPDTTKSNVVLDLKPQALNLDAAALQEIDESKARPKRKTAQSRKMKDMIDSLDHTTDGVTDSDPDYHLSDEEATPHTPKKKVAQTPHRFSRVRKSPLKANYTMPIKMAGLDDLIKTETDSDVPLTPKKSRHSREAKKTKQCTVEGCDKNARGTTGFCVKHGGGKRCQRDGCSKGARPFSNFCSGHGGGKRCVVDGCTKGALTKSEFCRRHGKELKD